MLALCSSVSTYVCLSVLLAGSVSTPVTGKHPGTAQSTDPAGGEQDDVAILHWLGSVVEEDITSFEE